MSTIRSPCANQATGISVPRTSSHGWWQPVNSGCGAPSTPSTWKLANGTGRVSSVISTSQRNDGGPGASFATSSSVTTRTRRPRSGNGIGRVVCVGAGNGGLQSSRSEEHTSELQSHHDLVCRLLLEKKNTRHNPNESVAYRYSPWPAARQLTLPSDSVIGSPVASVHCVNTI